MDVARHFRFGVQIDIDNITHSACVIHHPLKGVVLRVRWPL